jgi:ERCC4-type nuclease
LQGVGDKTAWAVLDVYPISNDLVGVTIDQLKRIDGVSPANAEAIKRRFG